MSNTVYELWRLDTGNVVGEYSSLSGALEVVRSSVQRNGEGALDGLGLLEVDRRGEGRLLARDRDLLALMEAPTRP